MDGFEWVHKEDLDDLMQVQDHGLIRAERLRNLSRCPSLEEEAKMAMERSMLKKLSELATKVKKELESLDETVSV